MSKRFIFTIITLLVIATAAGVAIFLAKGYTFSPKEKRIIGTGIITVSSQPDAASVYIDGHLTTATNATISSLSPKNYSVKIIKEGFIPWENQIGVKEGLVTEVKVVLFPAIPTIYPLTFSGVESPVLSPDGDKLSFVVPSFASNKKAGVWVWTMAKNQPIAFTRSSEPHQIATSATTDFSKAKLKWSADSKQVLATVENNNYLLDYDKLNSEPRDITPILSATLNSWEEDVKNKNELRIESIKNIKIKQIASNSAVLRWSPDETKFIARKNAVTEKELKENTLLADLKVYDLETRVEYLLPSARSHMWLPDSRHILLVEKDAISVVDFDGTNRAVIYAGSFLDNFVFPWPDSSRLVIISSFPTPTASEPNLYGINLK